MLKVDCGDGVIMGPVGGSLRLVYRQVGWLVLLGFMSAMPGREEMGGEM